MKHQYFITGTDTNVGKTWITLAMMSYFKQHNLSVVGMKPVASGCKKTNDQWCNSDALAIQKMGTEWVDYSVINPYAYELPISPHLAGRKNVVDLNKILLNFQILYNIADVVIVEGAGGWYTPINDTETMASLAQKLNIPIILGVAIKLGCISHAQLTVEAIQQSGLNCIGWIAVCNNSNFSCRDLTIESLKSRLPIPLLATFPYLNKADFVYLGNKIENL